MPLFAVLFGGHSLEFHRLRQWDDDSIAWFVCDIFHHALFWLNTPSSACIIVRNGSWTRSRRSLEHPEARLTEPGQAADLEKSCTHDTMREQWAMKGVAC